MRPGVGLPGSGATRDLLVGLLAILVLATAPASLTAHERTVPATEILFATVRVPVAARVIARGAVLTGDDITFEERPVARGIATDTMVAAGWVARRIISPGEILRPPAVQAPQAVAANGPLDISYDDGTVTMALRGIATRSASVGQRISVRLADGRYLDVIIVAPGKARIQ